MTMRRLALAGLVLCPGLAWAQPPPPGFSVPAANGAQGSMTYCWNGSAVTACGEQTSTAAIAALTVANVKNSPGAVFGLSVANLAAAETFIQFYNTAGTPVLGTAVQWFIAVPPSGTVNLAPGAMPLAAFTTGIGVGASTTATGAGTPATPPAVTVFYK
jgi:hypothetical protein